MPEKTFGTHIPSFSYTRLQYMLIFLRTKPGSAPFKYHTSLPHRAKENIVISKIPLLSVGGLTNFGLNNSRLFLARTRRCKLRRVVRVCEVLLAWLPSFRVPWLDTSAVHLVDLHKAAKRQKGGHQLVLVRMHTSSSVSPLVSGMQSHT